VGGLGFRPPAASLRPRGDHCRCSGGPRWRWSGERDSARCGEHVDAHGVDRSFLERRGEVAGVSTGRGELWLGRMRRSAAGLDKATVSEDTPDQRKKFRRKGRGAGLPRVVGFRRIWPQAPAVSGEESLHGSSTISRRSKGRWRRRVHPSYRWVRG
jgi:hypothetical protein